jgi:hypothetical protein
MRRQFGYGMSQKNFHGRPRCRWKESRRHHREHRHRLGGAIDGGAESGAKQVQNGGDERTGVADTDPEDEGDDVDAPHHRRVVAGGAEPFSEI